MVYSRWPSSIAASGWLAVTACCASTTSWFPAGVGEGVGGHTLWAGVQTGVLSVNGRGVGVAGAVAAAGVIAGAGICGSGAGCILE